MNTMRTKAPGGAAMRWLWGLALVAVLFSGMGQMPILKRYYITSLPLMGWSENFFTLSLVHYLAAGAVLALLGWRLALDAKGQGGGWLWGPRSWWGWLLLGLLVVSGAFKAALNAGAWFSPVLIMYMDFIHLFSAMALLVTAIIALFTRRGLPASA